MSNLWNWLVEPSSLPRWLVLICTGYAAGSLGMSLAYAIRSLSKKEGK